MNQCFRLHLHLVCKLLKLEHLNNAEPLLLNPFPQLSMNGKDVKMYIFELTEIENECSEKNSKNFI